jgi:hypothetical protein
MLGWYIQPVLKQVQRFEARARSYERLEFQQRSGDVKTTACGGGSEDDVKNQSITFDT